jgi:hypothetical protein
MRLRIAEGQATKSSEADKKEPPTNKEYLQFIALPRLSISLRRYCSALVARDAFERATLT